MKYTGVTEDMDVLRAFITVKELGGADSVNKFATHGGYTLGESLKAVFTEKEFIKAFSELPLDKLTPEAKQALAGLINSFANKIDFRITKGNIAHVLTVADMLKGSKYKILEIESVADELLLPSTTKFAGRRVDIKVEIEVDKVKKIIDIEFKNWQSNRWKGNLSASMSKTPKKTGEAAEAAAEEVGQLYTDLLRYMRDGNTGQQWVFTPDVIEDGVKKADMEDKIIKHIEDLINKHNDDFAFERGYDLSDELDVADWELEKSELFSSLNGGDDKQKFVQIYGYENITKVN